MTSLQASYFIWYALVSKCQNMLNVELWCKQEAWNLYEILVCCTIEVHTFQSKQAQLRKYLQIWRVNEVEDWNKLFIMYHSSKNNE